MCLTQEQYFVQLKAAGKLAVRAREWCQWQLYPELALRCLEKKGLPEAGEAARYVIVAMDKSHSASDAINLLAFGPSYFLEMAWLEYSRREMA